MNNQRAELPSLAKYVKILYATDYSFNKVDINEKPDSVRTIIIYPPFTNAEMPLLKSFKNLQNLEIRESQITDEGCKIIPQLKNLKKLTLTDLPITDDCIKYISESASLEKLYLDHTAITNKVFKYLREMPSLDYVFFGLYEDYREIDEKEIAKFYAYLEKRKKKSGN